MKHNLFHQSERGRDVELQNKQTVLSESPPEVVHVSPFSAQLRPGSELVDWYRDATSVPFGHLIFDLMPRNDDRLRYCTTSTGSTPSKFYVPDQLKQPKVLDSEHTKFLYFPSVLIIFPQIQTTFLSIMSERFHQDSLRMYGIFSQKNLQSIKKTSRDKISQQFLLAISKKNP